MGGAGVGKNHYIENTARFKDYTLVDIDVFKQAGIKNAMAMMQRELENVFARGDNVVHPTVGGVVLGNVNKLNLAKKMGYVTDVIYLKGSPQRGVSNVSSRVARGGHAVPDSKIAITYDTSEKAFPSIAAAADDWIIVESDCF